MLGLNGAGKTTILYNLKLGEVLLQVPTRGFNAETIEYKSKGLKIVSWDVGNNYYEQSCALIFVIDSSDKEKIKEAKEELTYLLQLEELQNAKVLIYANKQDRAEMSVTQIAQQIGLHEIKNQEWFIQGTCALSGNGLYEGLDWLVYALKASK